MTINQFTESGDKARLIWTLECGSAPSARIYATMKHLFSKLTVKQVEELISLCLRDGVITSSPHPIHPDKCFYALKKHG